MHRGNCSILDVGIVLGVGEVFLNAFHQEKVFEKCCGKKLSRKNGSKTLQFEILEHLPYPSYLDLVARKPVFNICGQVRLNPISSATATTVKP